MKTTDEILASWETEGKYCEWYAIDSYNPIDGIIRRLFVGTEDDALETWQNDYSQCGQNFYRIQAITRNDAMAFFENKVFELPDERGEYTITEAAGILGVTRQRVHDLIQRGKLDAHKRGNAWFVYRYSIENRQRGQ